MLMSTSFFLLHPGVEHWKQNESEKGSHSRFHQWPPWRGRCTSAPALVEMAIGTKPNETLSAPKVRTTPLARLSWN